MAMKAARNNRVLAAEALGKNVAWLNNRISSSPRMRAVYAQEVSAPTETDVMTRVNEGDGQPKDTLLALALMKQDAQLLRQGLDRAGISQDTLKKLQIFEDFSDNTGRFLVSTLDLTHRMQIYQNVALFEEAERIRDDILSDRTLSDLVRIEWMKRYIEISELIGKTFDRTLVGTQVISKLLKENNDESKGGGKRKPGFTPLTPKQVTPTSPATA